MSRSGYMTDIEPWSLICWRGQVASAIRGKRGQALIRDLIAALDAMPVKELIANDLEVDGKVCALGAVGRARGIDMSDIDIYDTEGVGEKFNVAHQLAAEVAFMNDEGGYLISPAQRWKLMREWAQNQLKEDKA